MPAQGHLFKPSATPTGHDPAAPPRANDPEPAPIWLQRTSLAVLVLFCFYIGIALAILPWGRYWSENGWLLAHPAVSNILMRGWARGVITGIGLLDIWIGISELLHYRDYRA